MKRRVQRIAVVLVDRANYGRLKPVMGAIRDQPQLELKTIAAGSMVLERFGTPASQVRADGFEVDAELHIELEGSTPVTMAKSVGFATIEFASALQRIDPDLVVVIGDRYEALGATIAAAYMNLPILHIQGGEVSGSIDESARHAMTKFAHFHYPATRRAAEYILRMGERPESILGTGCPSSDIARSLDSYLDPQVVNGQGSGATIDLNAPFLLVVYHPTTTKFGTESDEIREVLAALHATALPTVMLWPNIDAGSSHIGKAVRVFRSQRDVRWLRMLTNLSPEDYLRLLKRASCAIGNSSSFIRDASFVGTPVVLVGDRQNGREAAEHVVRVGVDADVISDAIAERLAVGRFPPSDLYGNGRVAEHVVQRILQLDLYIQKRLAY